MFWLILILLILIGIYLYTQNKFIKVTPYNLTIPNLPDNLKGKKIVHLSDIHLRENSNTGYVKTLISKVEAQEPDIILLTGDIIDAKVHDVTNTYLDDFCQKIANVAPVYAVTGNHDIGSSDFNEFSTTLNDAGIELLIDECKMAYLDGPDKPGLNIFGFAQRGDLSNLPKPYLKNIEFSQQMKDAPTIMLIHQPEYYREFIFEGNEMGMSFDLTLSGHTHGGQVQLPNLGGLYAPGQDFFPKFDSGFFVSEEDETKRLIISGGLGNSSFPIRINNRVEIVTIIIN